MSAGKQITKQEGNLTKNYTNFETWEPTTYLLTPQASVISARGEFIEKVAKCKSDQLTEASAT